MPKRQQFFYSFLEILQRIIMQKKMPLRGQLANRDSMSVDDSNSGLFEELMADVTEEDQQEIREDHATAMEKHGGYSAETIELMRNPQKVPEQSIERNNG